LTVPWAARYKAALAAALLAAPAAGLSADRPTLPDGAASVGGNRYRLQRGYEDALAYFRSVYPPARYPRRPIVNQPSVKAVHIENPEPKPGGWEGLNVYELKGETRVFVVVSEEEEKPRKGKRP
jgi:hypothetical protein